MVDFCLFESSSPALYGIMILVVFWMDQLGGCVSKTALYDALHAACGSAIWVVEGVWAEIQFESAGSIGFWSKMGSEMVEELE